MIDDWTKLYSLLEDLHAIERMLDALYNVPEWTPPPVGIIEYSKKAYIYGMVMVCSKLEAEANDIIKRYSDRLQHGLERLIELDKTSQEVGA